MKHVLTLTAAAFLLTGCHSLTLPVLGIIPPANLTAPCPDLEPAQAADMGDLLGVCIDTTDQYQVCKARHNALAAWVAR
ncbi:MAG: hypothetical protein K8U57_07420 [Planctomycetes bacterium]|nr:hypothetical protein [Planctomycetota bacterium]